MTESHEASAATLQALSRHELPVETPSPATVLITKQEVVLGTKAAVQAYLVDQGNSLCCVGDRPDVAALDGYTPTAALPIAVELPRALLHATRDSQTMNTLDAVTTICAFVLLVIFALGIQSLQARLEQWDYDRHFHD